MGYQEGIGEARRCAHQGGDPIQFGITEFDFDSTQSLGPPQLQINVQDAYDIGFGRSTYARKENEIILPMAPVPRQTKIRFDYNCQNNFNIHCLTHPRAVHIKTDAQVAYDMQLGRSWTSSKGKEISISMELVPCPKPFRINRDR
jgi:hypothetical protein